MKRIFSIIAILVAGVMALQAEDITLIVEELDATTTPFPLATTSKITFNGDGTLTFVETDDNKTDFEIANVGRILFQGTTDAKQVQDDSAARQISIYPNPAENAIVIDGLNEGENVMIYSEAGMIVLRGQYNGSEFNVAGLARGRYIVQADNVVVRLIKK